jgi:hypothetical protein
MKTPQKKSSALSRRESRLGRAGVPAVDNGILALDENTLRTGVVVPLLGAMNGIEGVNDVHGRNEKGLDVIFREVGVVRTTQFGVQLKADAISGGGGAHGTVAEVIRQLSIASEVVHAVVIDGIGEVKIEQFIVATNKSISETAKLEIAARMGKIPVDFWDGQKLLAMVRQHIPELLGHADAHIVAYLKPLVQRLDVLDALDQIPGVAKKRLSQVFEEPVVRRRFDPTIGKGESVSAPNASRPGLRLLDEMQSVIIAEQDAGKTALLRMLAMTQAKDILGGRFKRGDEPIPILVHSRELAESGGDVLTMLQVALARTGGEPLVASVERRAEEGSLLLLVDGFSELEDDEAKKRVERLLIAFGYAHPKSRIVVAARPADFLTPQYFANFRHYVIQDFSEPQVSQLLNRWTAESPVSHDIARRLVRRIHEALQLPGSPISATIGVMLYEKEHRFITNIAEAVERYMVIRLGRYAQELGMRHEVEWSRKQDLLAEVAVAMLDSGETRIAIAEIVRRFDDIYDRLGESRKSETVLRELVESGVLHREGDHVCFFRTGFRDFFAGHAINQMADRDEFALAKSLDRRWGLAIVFAAGLRRKNNDLLKGLVAQAKREKNLTVGDPSDQYLYGSYLAGKVLSNSESSDRNPKLAALRTCLTACVDSMPVFAAEAKRQFGNIGELAALIAVEQTFVASVGVPWLEKQFSELANDTALGDEAHYLLASMQAHLGLEGFTSALESTAKATKSTKVLLAMSILVQTVRAERELAPTLKSRLRQLQRVLDRRLARPGRRADRKVLTKVKSKLLELELRRLRRLNAANKN